MLRRFFSLFGGVLSLSFYFLASPTAQAQRPLGADVSGYQTSINWTTVKNAGIVFCWTKATQGTSYISPYFTSQEAGAKGVGIYIGAYHYATPSAHPNITGASSADSEASYFWSEAGSYITASGGYLMPMLDWEDPAATNLSASTLSAWVNEWCNDIVSYARSNGVTVKPVVYTGTWYSNPANGYPGLNTTVTNWPCNISAYPSNPLPQSSAPSSCYPWPTAAWAFWQYADTNASGGDSDVFNGTLATLIQNYVIGGTNAPNFTLNPTNITVALNSNATFSAKATGVGTSFQWYFDGKLIPGAISSNYTMVNVQLTNAGYYKLLATNSSAGIYSSVVSLSVLGPVTNAVGSVLAPANMTNWWAADGNPTDTYWTNDAVPYGALSYTNGKAGLAFHFDGSTSYLLVNGGAELPASWTVCLWVNRQNASGTSGSIFGDSTYALKLEQYPTTRQVGFTHSGVADYLFNPGYSVPLNTWTHLAFVATSTSVSLYTNGIFEGSTNVASLPLPRSSIGVDLISGAATDYMLGSLDEIQVFHSALTAAQIQAIYQAGSAGLVRAPQFTAVTATNNGQILLNLQGLTGKLFTLYTSTNLVNWSSLSTISNPTGAVQYLDSVALPQTFYRATQTN